MQKSERLHAAHFQQQLPASAYPALSGYPHHLTSFVEENSLSRTQAGCPGLAAGGHWPRRDPGQPSAHRTACGLCGTSASSGAILDPMSSYRARQRRHLASSPFNVVPEPEPEPAEQFAVADRVTHDRHGLGTVTRVERSALVIDFGTRVLRIRTPSAKLTKL